jgi:acyl transferase domain-containing protein
MKKLIDLKEKEYASCSQVVVEDDTIRDIAIIGVSAKLPMAENVHEFWKNIRNGCDCVSEIPKGRKADLADLVGGLKMSDVEYRELAYLKEIDKFDYKFFGISPREANLMDPNQRVFLETVWSAMEDAGYGGDNLVGSRTGVFLGYGSDSEYQMFVNTFEPSYTSLSLTGNIAPNIASRISYIMDFRGPNMLINTTCSSSLVALHTACQSLRNRECNQAIVGGIKLILLPIKKNGDMGIQSADARTRTFDDNSDGTGSGEGSIAIIIKPLANALKDRDHVYAVIKGSAVNHDGKSISIAAPNPIAQEDVIVRAWKDANIDPNTIRYIEAHGTATRLGDPIEIEGIKRAFSKFTDKKQFCAIGSVKSNINHLDSSSGLAGLLKAMLSLQHREIPPTLHYSIPNRNINFSDSPVYINNRLRQWEEMKYPRRCGVNSFGMSGTNCHVVLEEAPLINVNSEESDYCILTLSAKSKKALKEIVACYIELLENDTSVDISNLCYTANTGRGHYNYRIAIIAADSTNLLSNLETIEKANFTSFEQENIYCGECEDDSELVLEHVGKQSSEGQNQIYLNELARRYIRGANIDWNEVYQGKKYYKLSLPTYCFERTRCWLDISNKVSGVDDMLYQIGWVHKEVGLITEKTNDHILLIHDNNKRAKELAQKLVQKGFFVAELQKNEEKELAKLEDFFETCKEKVLKVIHCASLSDEINETKNIAQLEEKLDKGVYSLQRILGELSQLKCKIDLVLISEYAHSITKREKYIIPENAVMYGFGKNIHNENHRILCRCIDTDFNTDLDHVVNEINVKTFDYNVAYRENQRYVEEVQKYNTSLLEGGKIEIRENGVYVITGGLGYIGMEICRFISAKHHTNIVLINRSDFPERSLWNQINSEENEKLAKQIELVKELESRACNVEIYKADVTNEKELAEVIHTIHSKYGRIHGIFHCAAIGVGRKGLRIVDEVPQKLNYTMAPKIQGTWLLHKLTKDDGLDFMVLFSSAIVLMGGIRASAYVASNAYLDSFASLGEKGNTTVITVDWPTWSDIAVSPSNDNHLFMSFSTRDAMKVLERVLNMKMSRCIVGNMNMKSELFLLSKTLPFKVSKELHEEITTNEVEEKGKKIDVILTGREDGYYTHIEKEVASIIGNVLAISTIDINDNFFDLGGSSIASIKLEADFEAIGIPFKSSDIYEYSTVANIAGYIGGKVNANDETIVKKIVNQREYQIMDKDTETKLENIKGNYSIFYKSCFYNSLFPIIDYFSKEINTFLVNDVIAYGDVLGENGVSILDINYAEVEKFEKVVDNIGLKYMAKYYNEDVIEGIIHSIEKKRPVLIYVDCYYVPIREDCYNKKHLAHTWLVYGFDRINKKINILEHKSQESLNYTEMVVSYREVENAYIGFNDYFNTEEDMFSYYEFELKSSDNMLKKEDCQKVLASNMVQNKDFVLEGLKRLDKYAKVYPELILNERQFEKNSETIFNSINHIINAKKIEEFRWLRIFNDKGDDILSLIKEIITKWSHIRVKIGKCNYTSTYRKEKLETTIEELNRLIELEKELYKKQFSMFEIILK